MGTSDPVGSMVLGVLIELGLIYKPLATHSTKELLTNRCVELLMGAECIGLSKPLITDITFECGIPEVLGSDVHLKLLSGLTHFITKPALGLLWPNISQDSICLILPEDFAGVNDLSMKKMDCRIMGTLEAPYQLHANTSLRRCWWSSLRYWKLNLGPLVPWDEIQEILGQVNCLVLPFKGIVCSLLDGVHCQGMRVMTDVSFIIS